MVSSVWSVSCLLFYSRCPCAQPCVKTGARAPRAGRAPWSRRRYIRTYQPDTKSNPNPNHNLKPATKQHAIVTIHLNIVSFSARDMLLHGLRLACRNFNSAHH